ncbi:MAG TPA: leucine-rich repeat domain-containing protein, partial [Verrucomicrobiae bacterium]
VTNLAIYAFNGATNLTSVTLSTNVSGIENYVFYDCPALTAITVNTNNQWYSSLAGVLFDKSQDALIAYPAGNAATSYIMPNTVTNIGMESFFGSLNLTNVTLGTNVSIVGGAAFETCRALASISFPDSVTVIGGDAFSLCGGLTTITIGTGVTNIMDQAFLGCSSITTITVAVGNPAFSAVNGVLFNKNQTLLVLYPAGNNAASYAVPASVTNIMGDAFMNSYNLTAITLDPNLQIIGDSAFQQCYSLTSITIPNSVTNLGFSTFFYCFNLTNVVIGSGLGSIGFDVFSDCFNLAGVYFMSNAPGMNSDVFDVDNAAIAYYLPGTTNWGATFDGIPTALWLPQIVSSGVRTNQFSFRVNWASGQTVVVEGCTNLFRPAWSPVQTNALTSNSWYFSDPQSTKYSSRFYRAISP